VATLSEKRIYSFVIHTGFCYEKHLASSIRMESGWVAFWATIGTLVFLGLTGISVSGVLNLPIAGFPQGLRGIFNVILQFFSNFIPFSLLTFGFMSDLVHQQFKAGLPSSVAIGLVFLSAVISRLVAGTTGLSLSRAETSGNVWCTIPGLEQLESPYIPMAFVITSCITSYYTLWSVRTMKNSPENMSFAILGMVLIFIQMATFAFIGDCPSYYRTFELPYIGRSAFINILAALVYGSFFGYLTYQFTHAFDAVRWNPYIARNPYEKEGFESEGRTEPVQDTDQTFVAEIYKNGQPVTDSLV